MKDLDIFKVRVLPPDLMKKMLKCINKMPAERRRNYSKRVSEIIPLIEKEAVDPVANCASILLAFEFRLEALLRLREQPQYKAWSLGETGGSDFVDEAIVETAATQPIIEIERMPAFEPKAFFEKVLELAQTAGKA